MVKSVNKMINEEVKYSGKRFNVVQRVYENENNFQYVRDCVETRSAVVILTIDEEKKCLFCKTIS